EKILLRYARVLFALPTSTALQNQHIIAALCEPKRGNCATKTTANYDGVKVQCHGGIPPMCEKGRNYGIAQSGAAPKRWSGAFLRAAVRNSVSHASNGLCGWLGPELLHSHALRTSRRNSSLVRVLTISQIHLPVNALTGSAQDQFP